MVIDSLPQAEYQSANQGFPWNLELVVQARTIAVMLDSLGNGFYFNFLPLFFRAACHLALLPCLLTSDMFVFLYSLFLCSCIPLWIPVIPSLQALWGRMIPAVFAQPSTVGVQASSVLC